ncbi:MAG: hypothetical protein IKC89_05040 [Lentisphaeria bacterium]|nr:hypothetical protein [Lentisphaeria bacterium]
MLKRKLALVMLIAVCGCGLFAAPWSTHNARRTPQTLMVIGNYFSPYVLAETYLGLTNQPYLRVMQDGKLYLVLTKVIREVAPQELTGIIDSLNLKRIVIIGDERFVSPDFEKTLRKTNIKATPILRIYGENWLRVAEELDFLLNVGHLSRNFRENLQDASIRTNPAKLKPLPRQKKADAPAEAPAAGEVKAPADAAEAK